MSDSNRVRMRLSATSLIVAGLLLAGVCPAVWATEYYIDPNGDPNGLGTIGDPWSIAKLDDPNAAAPGDTVWLRGGTYYWPTRDDFEKGFGIDLRGDANNPITVRNYDGEHAMLDGGLHSASPRNPQYLQIWGLDVCVSEFMDPNHTRSSTESTSWPSDMDCPQGGIYMQAGTGLKIINCWTHDARNSGFGMWGPLGAETTVHGCISSSNGWDAPDRRHGHGMYTQNESGSMRYITESMFIENYGDCINAYGTSAAVVDDYVFEGNIFTPYPDSYGAGSTTNIASGWYRDNTTFNENICWWSTLWVGYDAYDCTNITITDNYFINAHIRNFGSWAGFTTSGNVEWWDSTWNGEDPNEYDPPEWTAGDIVDLRVNDYESDRANLFIVQPEGDANDIAVDFSSWLTSGDIFELKDPRDLWGNAVFTATYTGSSIDVPVGGEECAFFVCFKTGTAATNSAPVVDAGSSANVQWPTTTTSLDGTVSDDGNPTPATLTQAWSKDSGPGTVTFTNANAVDTTATFSTTGTYVLRLAASDTALSTADTVTITVVPEAEDTDSILFDMGSNDEPDSPETDGKYWNHLGRAETSNAWDTIVDSNAVDANNATTGVGLDVYDIANQNKNLSRKGTYPYNCENDGWNYGSNEGSQAIIRITGLDDGETYTMNIHSSWPSDPWWYGSGQFTCQGTSHYYDDDGAAIYTWTELEPNDGEIDLEMNTWCPEGENPISGSVFSIELIELIPGGSGNGAPTVDAGSSADVELPTSTTSLDGTVSDDGNPTPATLTQTWSKDSGPGTVTFTNANAVDTTATFSAAGTYVLKLTADDTEKSTSDTVTVTVWPTNTAPTVDAGTGGSITLPTSTFVLDASVSDDGLPLAGNLTQTWSKDSGAGTVTFTNANAVDTTATFSAAGTYVLRLTASDGTLSDDDTVTVTVNPAASNSAPTVGAGADDSITMPTSTYSLDGTVNDDGLPDPPAALTYTWAKDSGPGTVTFTNASAVDTTATFGSVGTYVLRLTASDSALNDYDTVQITVNAAANTAPTVNAGANDSITMPTDTYSLDGTVNDDGLPDPPAALTYTWGKDSGPGTVTFTNSSAVDTTATFSTIGTYVLRLTASDSALNDYDTVQITVNEASGDPNLLLHLKFDESSGNTAYDSSGNNLDSTVQGTSWETGHIDNCVQFVAGDYVTVDDFDLTNDFSMSFWFKSLDNSGSYEQYMVCWNAYHMASNISVWLCEDSNGNAGLLRTSIRDTNDSQNILDIDDPNNYLDGGWHHYCATVSGDNGVKVYVDGTLEASDPNNGGDAFNPTYSFRLGSRVLASSLRYFYGQLDDLRFYDDELTAAQVADLADD